MRASTGFALCALVACVALTACGDSDNTAPSTAEWDAMQETLDDLGAALDTGDVAAVCAGVGARAREQLKRVGHGISADCAAGLRMLAPDMRKRRAADDADRPEIESVAVQKAIVTVKVDDRLVRIPFSKEGRRWRVDSFYGIVPRWSLRFD